jgi:hypothetical protein
MMNAICVRLVTFDNLGTHHYVNMFCAIPVGPSHFSLAHMIVFCEMDYVSLMEIMFRLTQTLKL